MEGPRFESGKHGPSLRSIGLLAGRARLILQVTHGALSVKCPFNNPRSTKPPRSEQTEALPFVLKTG